MPDVVVVGAGPERARRRHHVRRGRPLGARPRGGRHHRRRRPHRGAHAAGLPPRRVLGDPPAGRGLAVLRRRPTSSATASSWSTPRSPSSTRSTTAAPACSTGRSTTRWPGLGRRRRGPGTAHVGWAARRWDVAGAGGARPARCGCPAIRSRWPGSALRAMPPGHRRSAAPSAPTRRAGSSPARPPTRSSRCRARSPRRMGLMLLASATWPAGPARRGGSQAIADAMAARLAELGGEIETGRPVRSLDDVPDSRAVLFDVTPRQLLRICGDALPDGYQRPAAAASATGPASSRSTTRCPSRCRGRTPTPAGRGRLHLGGTLREIAAAEADVAAGRHPERPFVLVGPAEPLRPHPGARRASTRSGPTATCRPAPRST